MEMIQWKVKGYAGHDDYDGPSDDNFKHIFQTSDNLTEADMDVVIQNRYKDKRVLVYEIEKEQKDIREKGTVT